MRKLNKPTPHARGCTRDQSEERSRTWRPAARLDQTCRPQAFPASAGMNPGGSSWCCHAMGIPRGRGEEASRTTRETLVASEPGNGAASPHREAADANRESERKHGGAER